MKGTVISIATSEIKKREDLHTELMTLCANFYEDQNIFYYYPAAGKLFDAIGLLKLKGVDYSLNIGRHAII